MRAEDGPAGPGIGRAVEGDDAIDGGSSALWVLGVDSGGSGLRVALAPAPPPGSPTARPDRRNVLTSVSRVPVRTGPGGIDAAHLLEQLLPMARDLLQQAGNGRAVALAMGAAGMATLGDELRAVLPAALARELGVGHIALAADAVTAYAGALGRNPGAVVAAGTGLIALGTDLTSWRRADGWGHLLGDCGGGAWIGRAGLEAAFRAHDGREGGSQALRERAEEFFDGPLTELPGKLYPRTDRPAVLASFAPEVGRCAELDPVAADVVRDAARHIAAAAAAVCPDEPGSAVGLTGGLFGMGDVLLEPLRAELARRLPRARTVTAEGDPLDGAVSLATWLWGGGPVLPDDGRLLALPKLPDDQAN